MQFQNKNKIAYLGALTLLFSYAEMLLPKIVPFFRFGLGNIAILLALDLSFPDFLILTIVKSVTSSLMSGTLFSPFFIISLVQSILSGIFMFLLARLNKASKNRLVSIFGISICGSALSAMIQILLCTLYLGKGTFALSGPMLLFSLLSGTITAFFSVKLHIPEQAPELIKKEKKSNKTAAIIIILAILCASAAIFMINNIYVLAGFLILSFIAQIISHRKIKFLPHLSIWIFVIFTSIFIPNGRVLFSIGNFNITQGALLTGIIKSIKLSAVSALSQCAASLRPDGNGLISLVLSYFTGLNNIFRNTQGNLFEKIKITLQSENLTE